MLKANLSISCSLLDAAEVGVLEFSGAGRLRWASPRALELLGIAETRGLIRDGAPCRAALMDCLQEARKSAGAAVSAVLTSTTGESLLALSQHVASKHGRGRVTFLLRPIMPESTDRRDAGAVEFLSAMLEGSHDGLWLLSAMGEILNVNAAAERLSGLRREAMIGRKLEHLSSELSFDCSTMTEVISRKASLASVQTRADGRKHLVSGQPIIEPGGALRYVLFSVQDISQMNRTMTRLHETEMLAEGYRKELRNRDLREVKTGRIVTQSAAMRAVWDLAIKYAVVDSPVLLLGETGSGKRIFAKVIHEASARSAGPFLEVNCGAIPEALIEAELFGYAKGAFTGADPRGKPGLADLAHSGCLLLDEIGDLPISVQVKLLRFLEDGEIWPVGALKGKRPDVRILAATNRDLATMVAQGTFRRDLFYRLNVLTIHLPPLREHPEDIPALVETTLAALKDKYGRQRTFTPAALALLTQYAFPGNVRELWNLVERLVVTVDSETIDVRDLPPEVGGVPRREDIWREAVQALEARMVREALEQYRIQALAAKHLGVSQATIARKAKLYGLQGSPGFGRGTIQSPAEDSRSNPAVPTPSSSFIAPTARAVLRSR